LAVWANCRAKGAVGALSANTASILEEIGERLVFNGAEKRTQSRLKVGADLLTFAAGFLLGSMFGACVGALTIGLLRAAKRDDANSISLHKPEDEVTQKAYPSRIHDHRKA
jgi:hypothetical protein